jgi:hypothetical protein
MALAKNSTAVRLNKLFSGVYDINFNFKEKNYLELKEGDVVFSRGDKSENMYLLIQGRIKLKTYENPRQPKVYLVGKNEFFGEKELLDKTNRNSSAVAEKDTVLFSIGYKDFIKLASTHKKIHENLSEKKYEEVVAPTRKSEYKEDIFKRILNEAEPVSRKKNGIELRDYSYENPLLELKAKDEISEALKMYEEKEDIINFDETDTIPDDTDELTEEESEEVKEEPEDVFDEFGADEEEIPEEPAEDIVTDFIKIQEQVNSFSESLTEPQEEKTEEPSFPEPEPVKNDLSTNESFIAAVEKLNSGLDKEETDRLIIEACCGLVNAERGILYYPDENNVLKGKLYEEDAELIAGPDTIAGKCLRQSKIINIKDVFDDPDFNPDTDYTSFFHIQNLICIPVAVNDRTRAVLQLFNSLNDEFSENDEQILTAITPVISKSIERWKRFRKKTEEREITALAVEAESKSVKETEEKQIKLKVLMDFLLQEFQVIISDVKQFNAYLQRIDIPGEAKEISDIVTSQTTKIIDLLDALKSYSDKRKTLQTENLNYVNVFEDMVNLLAEFTEGRKVNLYKRFETDANIMADPKFLYLSVFQLIKYQCDLMPFGGNIFISSNKTESTIEVSMRNATKKTDESLVVSPAIDYNENTPTGIGLSLARRIIEDHNAALEINSQSGTGLEIIIRFPLA